MAVIPGMGHKHKYHIVIRVIRWKECGGQPELGIEEKAGVGWAGQHPDNCQETATKKTDVLHVTTSWRNLGARYDCTILQGFRQSGLNFCQVCAIFMISIVHEWYHLAVMRIYEQK